MTTSNLQTNILTDAQIEGDLATFRDESDHAIQLARANGIVVDMSHWLTVKRYAQKYGLTVNVVINWINRGVIPADCVQTVPELNNIRLVKDQPYRQA